jgi:hypothetical protein
MYGYQFCSADRDCLGFAQAAATVSAASTPPKFHPVKSDILAYAGALTQLTTTLSHMHVKQGDKGAYISVDNCITLAFHSDITKAAQAQTKDRGSTVSGGTDPNLMILITLSHMAPLMRTWC